MKVVIGIDSGANGGAYVLYPDKAAFAAPIGSHNRASRHSGNRQKIRRDKISLSRLFRRGSYGLHRRKAAARQAALSSWASHTAQFSDCLSGLGIPLPHCSTAEMADWASGVRGIEYTARKRRLKEIAAERYPQLKPTLKTADAILIADYGKGASHGA